MASFRFLDLPSELRNKIYSIVLCSFEPAPPSESLGKGLVRIQSGRIQEFTSGICPAVHSIQTDILCTSKQVHREAYDVMVKTNQFVHVRTVDISMSQLLVGSQVPIVTLDRAHAEQFQGYLMKIAMHAIPGGSVDDYEQGEEDLDFDDFDPDIHAPRVGLGPYFSFMILGRDWKPFCHMLSEADIYIDGFSTNVKILLTMNPWPEEIPNYKAPIVDLFTLKTQEALLKPFRSQLRGFTHVEMGKSVSPDFVQAVLKEVASSPWTDPRKVLQDLYEAKDLGARYYEENKITEASERWTTAISDVRRMRSSSSWPTLAQKGESHFVQQLAQLQFALLLSSAQNSLRVMNASPNNQATLMTVGDVVTYNLQEAVDLPDNFARDGSLWQPSDAQMAALYFAQAQCWRLMDEVDLAYEAGQLIEMAMDLTNGDAEIEAESARIAEWVFTVGEIMTEAVIAVELGDDDEMYI
ncbi:hypothetical protein K504DRAFT_424837 [Pleomassaria siparia CBS 279.74]|uniref:Uncharacterized protein n=1 Tax=Pleomassaria siparia CBS 279.74 TaxID=1314801 RepID=A0A6G1KNF3_9PLEO|nr:hypothetical protein K504DRAFT_424837 [Pleomassaria siparia CBS 279.74]